jgi:hypothetical protein
LGPLLLSSAGVSLPEADLADTGNKGEKMQSTACDTQHAMFAIIGTYTHSEVERGKKVTASNLYANFQAFFLNPFSESYLLQAFSKTAKLNNKVFFLLFCNILFQISAEICESLRDYVLAQNNSFLD